MATLPNEIIDGFINLDGGVNSGIAPVLLAKNQLGAATNVSLRGDLPTARPPYRKINLTFPDSVTQTAFEGGLFQGAGVYVADGGEGSVMASITGRLYQIIPRGTDTAQVLDVTPASDQNEAGVSQVWIWQSEKWAIWNDGVSLPVFFDGVGSRRSLGSPTFTVSNNGSPWQPPTVGSTLPLTLSSQWTYGDTQVILGGHRYAVTNGAITTITLLAQQPPQKTVAYATGTELVYNPQLAGVVINVAMGSDGVGALTLDRDYKGKKGDVIDIWSNVSGKSHWMSVTSVSGHQLGVSTNYFDVINGHWADLADFQNRKSYAMIRGAQYGTARTVGVLGEPIVAPGYNESVSVKLTGSLDSTYPVSVLLYDGKVRLQVLSITESHVELSNTINVTNNDGTNANPTTVPDGTTFGLAFPELPTGTVGAYGLGRNWMALPDGISFVASDLVNGSSGSTENKFRDAVLKISENTYLNGGGAFRVPGNVGSIKAMAFTATLDASLGQGPLQVYTPEGAFSCAAPTDRNAWQTLVNPILTQSLIKNGGLSQDATRISNGDTITRSKDGIRSLILARREFSTWGNTPSSREVQPTMDGDDKTLLTYASAVVFDNRYLLTANPVQSNQGVYFTKLVAMNFDPLSSLRGKSPAIYDGVWGGLNVLNLQAGEFASVDRAFALCLSATNKKIELWEILPQSSDYNDNPVWSIESPPLLRKVNKRDFDPCRLIDGKIFVDQIQGVTRFDTYFRPDYDSEWHPWHSFVVNSESDYQSPLGLGEPMRDANQTGKSAREGAFFQVKIQVTGRCRIMGCEVMATLLPNPKRSTPLPAAN